MVAQNSINQILKMAPGGLNLIGVTYPRVSLNNSAIGDNDVYTVPAGRRALVMFNQYYNTTGSTGLIFPDWKISGVYRNMRIAINNTAAGSTNPDANGTGWILEAGETFAYNASITGINAWTQIIEFSNQSNLKMPKVLGSNSGDQTIYTCPAGKKAIIMNGNGLSSEQSVSSIFISNNTGGALTSNMYLVPNGGSKGNNNILAGSISPTNLRAIRAVIGNSNIMNAGDFIVWNTAVTNTNCMCGCMILEV